MKNKLLTFAFAICIMIPCALMLTACGSFETNVKYVISDVSIVWGSEQEKNTILGEDNTEEEIISNYSSTEGFVKFKDDGTVESGSKDTETRTYYYTKDGNNIKVYSDEAKENLVVELEVDGGKLIQKVNYSDDYDSYIKVIYEKE